LAKGIRKVTKSIGFTLDLLDELEWMICDTNPNRKFVSLTEAIHKLVGIGLIMVKTEGKIDSVELMEKMNGLIKDEKIMDWINNLSPSQRIGLKQMIELTEERKQTHL
jgi:hypothetical protein